MIKKFNNYDQTRTYSDREQLPKGAYTLKVLGVSLERNDRGEYIKLSADIADGEYNGFFAKDYKNQDREDKKWRCNYLLNIPADDGSERDEWTKRRFKTVIEAFEESNPGFHWAWEEQALKGKSIGGLFNIRQYRANDGTVRSATNLARLCSVEQVQSGRYKLPEDKLISVAQDGLQTDGFMNIPDAVGDEGLPFN